MNDALPRLAVIHTVATLVPLFKQKLADAYPSLDTFHILDESLLQDLIRHGQSPSLAARILGHVLLAEKAGATAVLFTCSSTSPAVDVARQAVNIPIVKIDDAMARLAVTSGRRIGLVCTATSTVGPSTAIIESHAADLGCDVKVLPVLVEDAFKAAQKGDREVHDKLVRAAAVELAKGCDVLVLAQASMAHLAEALQQEVAAPVLSSPDLCITSLPGTAATAHLVN